jgi:hypothetical protein
MEIEHDDIRIFANFGRAMCSAQLLDFTVFQLAHLDKRSPKDMDRATRQIEGLLKQPTGDQAKTISDLDPDLLDDLQLAVSVRNRLAHDFLIRYRVEKVVNRDATAMATAFLTAANAFIGNVRARLDALADERLTAKGLEHPYLDDDEMDDLMRSIGRWSRSGDEELQDATADGYVRHHRRAHETTSSAHIHAACSIHTYRAGAGLVVPRRGFGQAAPAAGHRAKHR